MFRKSKKQQTNQTNAEKYNSLSNEEKGAYLANFFFVHAKIFNPDGELSANQNPLAGNSGCESKFHHKFWDSLNLDLQFAILESLATLDEEHVRHPDSIWFSSDRSTLWPGLARKILPLIVEKVYTPGKKDSGLLEFRVKIINLWLEDSYDTDLLRSCFKKRSVTDNPELLANTLLNDSILPDALKLAVESNKLDFIIDLFDIRNHYNIESEYFKTCIVTVFESLINNKEYELAMIARKISEILDHLSSYYFIGFETRLLDSLKNILKQRLEQDPKLADCLNYRHYGIKLANDPEPAGWLPQFSNYGAKVMKVTASATTALVVGVASVAVFNRYNT